MPNKFSPLAIANEFIAKAPGGIDHMKLQKLVYMAHEWWLASHDDAFLAEDPEVWPYGPVFSSLYHQLKYFQANLITELQDMFGVTPRVDDPDVLAVIEAVWNKYKIYAATYLSNITHEPGTPWHTIANSQNFRVPKGTKISAKNIKDYARAKIEVVA